MTAARERIESSLGRGEFIVLMSMLMATAALATDMMMPAFPEMRDEYGLAEDSNAVAMVVTAFFIGLGLGQPVWGPLSDSLGRKRVLWAGLAVYAVAAFGAALSPTLPVLLAWRLLAGFGAGSMRAVSHGVIRDAYRGAEMAKVLSYTMAVFIVVPILAPSLGSLVLLAGSWQWVFGALLVFALIVGAWSLRLPETLPAQRRIPLRLSRLVVAVRTVVASRFAMGLTIAQTAAFGFFMSYLASSQIIVADVFGLGPWFPLIFGVSAAVLGVAALLNPWLLDRFGLRPVLRTAAMAYALGMFALATIALATSGVPPFWLYAMALAATLFSHSLLIPNLNSAAMMPMGAIAGTAAAVIGSTAMAGGAAIGALIDRSFDGTITPLALSGLGLSLLAYATYRWADAVWVESADADVGEEFVVPIE